MAVISLDESMDDVFKIYIDQLKDGRERKINESLSPDFIDISEKDVIFNQPVNIQGVAYLAEDELILHWDVQTSALIPCSICNELVSVSLNIQNFYHSEPIEKIKTGIYYFKDILRETIILELPAFAECADGNCPKRKEYERFLKETTSQENEEEGYRPFADFDWKS